jgi:hypothetical protein
MGKGNEAFFGKVIIDSLFILIPRNYFQCFFIYLWDTLYISTKLKHIAEFSSADPIKDLLLTVKIRTQNVNGKNKQLISQ